METSLFMGGQINYATTVENLSGKDKVHFIAELEKVSSITDKNTELVSDLNKLVIKDPEKVLALKQLNVEVEVIKSNIIDIDNRVKKMMSVFLVVYHFGSHYCFLC